MSKGMRQTGSVDDSRNFSVQPAPRRRFQGIGRAWTRGIRDRNNYSGYRKIQFSRHHSVAPLRLTDIINNHADIRIVMAFTTRTQVPHLIAKIGKEDWKR
ncbi:hypothetical protein [Collimonas arenae]|uniref:hypothetical protein n=1 Tax=Collimonas arenae TaxID=279058 RepID=UPI000778730E|nr:hypothetical protein [Collimonas arenae]